jgi:hypothetical protein
MELAQLVYRRRGRTKDLRTGDELDGDPLDRRNKRRGTVGTQGCFKVGSERRSPTR